MFLILVILWLVFVTMTVSALFYKNHQNNNVLGVSLSRKHVKSPAVQNTIKRFTKGCYTVLVLSIGLSLLVVVKGFREYAEFYMFLLVIANSMANWYVVRRYQQKLLRIKEKNAWSYQRTKVVTVDLNASKEKGKSGVTSLWVWLFLCLSFIPVIYLILNPQGRATYPIGFSFIGPLCQLITVILYYQLRNLHAPALSDNTEINKICARKEERINTMAGTLSALAMLVYWILFNFSIIYMKNGILIMLSSVSMVIALLIIANWQQRKIRTVESRFFGELWEDEDIYEGDNTWKWGCYYNPDDSRIIVPKRIAGMGWTINIGRPAGKAIGIGFYGFILVFSLVIIGMVFYGALKDYRIMENGSELVIDAAMYDISFEKDEVVTVSITDNIPKGTRTNGYGGINKSYGHFSLDGYGKCMLYIYNGVDKYIVLEMEGDNPGYVIINGKSGDETEQLYKEILGWMD